MKTSSTALRAIDIGNIDGTISLYPWRLSILSRSNKDDEDEDDESDEEQVDYDDSDDSDTDDNDRAGDAAAGATGTSNQSTTSKVRMKKKQDKAPGSSTKPAEEGKATEEVEVVPLRRLLDEKLAMILDAQRIIKHSVSYDKEEGEIIHCLTKEKIAELFRLNPDKVVIDDSSVPASNLLTPEAFDDVDEVILEELDDDEETKYTSAEEELPTFTEFFGQHS
ncbi:hypothetical protein R6Q57_024632 [Mikania cordata]